MDILQHAVEETAVLHLKNAADQLLYDEKEQPVTVTVYGPGSKPYAKAQAARMNRYVERTRRKGRIELSADDQVRETAEFLAACTVEFSPNFKYGDSTLEGEALFRAVYGDKKIGFIAEQVNAHLTDWANFTKGSATS
jgi:hypothetical protein